jgi:hypothetical protein
VTCCSGRSSIDIPHLAQGQRKNVSPKGERAPQSKTPTPPVGFFFAEGLTYLRAEISNVVALQRGLGMDPHIRVYLQHLRQT